LRCEATPHVADLVVERRGEEQGMVEGGRFVVSATAIPTTTDVAAATPATMLATFAPVATTPADKLSTNTDPSNTD
jgi:hypothetical protein